MFRALPMKPFFIKLGLLLYLWYEVAAELRMTGGTTLAFTLLACGAGMMHPRLPERILALPRLLLLAGPAAVWFGLIWWLLPTSAATYPALALFLAAILALAGAGARYAAARYPSWFGRWHAMARGGMVPAAVLLLAFAGTTTGVLTVTVFGMLVVLPLCLGWRMMEPALARSSSEFRANA